MKDYRSIFTGENTLTMGRDFLCRLYHDAGAVKLPRWTRYPVLFVLRGEIVLVFDTRTLRVEAGHLLALDVGAVRRASCSAETVLLEYTPPPRLEKYLRHCTEAFQRPYIAPVPVLAPLEGWLDSLFDGQSSNGLGREQDFARRKALVKILLEYPRDVLDQLYVPLFACTRSSSSCLDCQYRHEQESATGNPCGVTAK